MEFNSGFKGLKTILNMSASFIADLQAYCSLTHNVRSLRTN